MDGGGRERVQMRARVGGRLGERKNNKERVERGGRLERAGRWRDRREGKKKGRKHVGSERGGR